jgi:putative endonuclease
LYSLSGPPGRRAVSKAGVATNNFLRYMSFFTYILECSDSKYYTGFTDDLEARVIAHNTGEYPNAYTLRRRAVKLVFYEEFEDADSAKEFERQIKKWTRVKMEALIAGRWDKLPELSKKKFR